jgi:hypothetical protein
MRPSSLILTLLLVAGSGVLAGFLVDDQPPLNDDEKAVRVPLEAYLEGHRTGQREVMARAFWPDAHLTWVRNDTLMTRSLEEYLSGLDGAPAPDEAQRKRRILEVDVAGTAAVGKIELDYPDAHFIDYMTLLEKDGEWRISHKSFHVERKQP